MKRREPAVFENPVLRGFHPDPSLCRVGRDFYLVTSSFEYFPGVPIFHSRDLVHWRQLGHVLTRKSQLELTGVRSSAGIYAPTLRHHAGRFYLVTTHVGGGGNFFVTARRPEGPWSEPKWIGEGGIDPSLLFDDGRVYYLSDGDGRDFAHPRVYQAELDLRRGKPKGKPRVIWEGTGGIWPEGAHVYRRGDYFYLFAAEGGTSYDHSEVVARSRSPFGPFEPSPTNPILTHRDRRGHRIQATGHVDIVDLDDGTTWAVFLGVRPVKARRHHLGRETFLAPVTWNKAGWPVIGKGGVVELSERRPRLAPHPFPETPSLDDFDATKLDPAWLFLRNPEPKSWSLRARPGWLRLWGNAATLDRVGAPAFVGRVQPEFRVHVWAQLDFAPQGKDEAGLVVRGNEGHHYALAIRATEKGNAKARGAKRVAQLVRRLKEKSVVVAERFLPEGLLTLEIAATPSAYTFYVTAGTRRFCLGPLPTIDLAAESIDPTGGAYFTGVVLAMYATGNGRRATAPADFDWFELSVR